MRTEAIRIGVEIQGRVQGVGFRWFVVTHAQRLRLRGWVRNTRAGSVQVRAEGSAAAIAEFRSLLAKGPPAARVMSVLELPDSNEELPAGFEIARSDW